MSTKASKSIEVRAGMDRDYFYIGYSPSPGSNALGQSIANTKLYEPSPKTAFENEDGSVTIRFSRLNLGFGAKERYRNFSDFLSEQVVPQLMDAVEVDVAVPGEISEVELYASDMSLFASGITDPETERQAA